MDLSLSLFLKSINKCKHFFKAVLTARAGGWGAVCALRWAVPWSNQVPFAVKTSGPVGPVPLHLGS